MEATGRNTVRTVIGPLTHWATREWGPKVSLRLPLSGTALLCTRSSECAWEEMATATQRCGSKKSQNDLFSVLFFTSLI
jgi:hypothetical protein